METAKKVIEKLEDAIEQEAQLTPAYDRLHTRLCTLEKQIAKLKQQMPTLMADKLLGLIPADQVKNSQRSIESYEECVAELTMALPVIGQRLNSANNTKRRYWSKINTSFARIESAIQGGNTSVEYVDMLMRLADLSVNNTHRARVNTILGEIKESR